MSNRILALRQDKADAIAQAGAILQKADAGQLTTEEVTQAKELQSRAQKCDEDIKQLESLGALVSANAHTDASAHNRGALAGGPGGVQVHDNILDKPWGYEARGAETKEERLRRVCFGFGEYLTDVKNAAIRQLSGMKGDPRLYALNEQFEKRAAAAGASEFVGSDGGFLVYPQFADTILELTHETGVLYPRTRNVPISEFTNSIKIRAIDEQSRKDGSRLGGIQGFWENEAQSLTGSKPAFNIIEMVLKKLTGLFYATNELLADAQALGDIAMRGFAQEFGFKLDDGCMRGTGSGQMLGVLNSPALVTVGKENNQLPSTVVTGNIKKMWARMWAPSRQNAVWVINQDVEPQLFDLSVTVGTGGVPIFLPPGVGGSVFGAATAAPNVSTNAVGGFAGTLLGRPVLVAEQSSTLGTVGDIMLVDWDQYLMINKGGLQTASSSHVRFLTDELTYRFIMRVDGQPYFKVPITPANGTNSFSPYIALAAR